MASRRIYVPINPDKYNGPQPIVLKSSWEVVFAEQYCDLNPNCIEWGYEAVRIPYYDPVASRQTIYIPDFLFSYNGTSGNVETALIEIKPLKERSIEYARSGKDAANVARNEAKWAAAEAWCWRRGNVKLQILTEAELFGSNVEKPKCRQREFGK